MENSPKNLSEETKENIEEETIDIENLETRAQNISERFKKIINDLNLDENHLSGSFADVYGNFRNSIVTYPDLENYQTIQKRIGANPQLYQIRIESIENYLDLMEKYPNFLKLEISNKDQNNWGGLHNLLKEAEEERAKIMDSGDSSPDKRERVDIYIKKCSDWLNKNGDVKYK